MAVDRGSLQYTIKLKDEFSRQFAAFKKGARESKAAFADLKRTAESQRANSRSFKDTTKSIDEQTAALKRAAAETRRTNAIGAENARIQRTLSSEQTKLARERLAAFRKASQEQQRLLQNEQRAARDAAKAQKAALNDQLRNLKATADAQKARERDAVRINAAAQKDAAANIKAEQQALKARIDAQNKQVRQAQKLEEARRRDEARRASELRRLQQLQEKADPQFQAQRRLNQALREEAIQRQQIVLLRARAQAQFGQGDLIGGSRTLRQVRDLEKEIRGVTKSANNLLFTFRRIIGVLAVFTLARNLVQGFQDLVKAGINFNDKVQSATTAIAGLLVAVTDVRDQFGNSVTPAEQLTLAVKAAQDQVRKLRQDALRTVATFEQLLSTFQIAVAPGFAAGLNLDEIRKLTVSISQAASAIGVEQNQLAEEVRSLLSGTIQARTTRIATALGVTNADIRRLKETGELFSFLEDKFAAFGKAAEIQARTTLEGISTLTKGAFEEILGAASGPLFRELLDLGNQFFDQVLTIVDAEGQLKPNPQIVKGFEQIFEALRAGVQEISNAVQRLGFDNLQNTFAAAGAALLTLIRFAIGAGETLLFTFGKITSAVRAVADFFGLTVQALGRVAAGLGVVVGVSIAWNSTLGLIGINFKNIFAIVRALIPALALSEAATLRISAALRGSLVAVGQIGAAAGVALIGFDLILSSILDTNLSLTETIRLVSLGLVQQVKESIAGFKSLATIIAGTLAGEAPVTIAEKVRQIVAETKAAEEEFNKKVAKILEGADKRAGFDPAALLADRLNAASKAGADFKGIISAADAEIAALAGSLFELQDQILTAGEEFRAAFDSQDIQGVGAKIQDIFSDQLVAAAEKLRKLRKADETVEKSISKLIEEQGTSAERLAAIQRAASSDVKGRDAALRALDLTAAEGQLVSLLRDQKDIREALNSFEEKSLQLAFKKAALLAVQTSRDLNREAVLLRQQVSAEQSINNVIVQRLGARRQATVQAENDLALARAEAKVKLDSLQQEIAFLEKRLAVRTGPNAPTAAERSSFEQLLESLKERLAIEQALTDEQVKRLEFQKQEAALIESGTLGQGLTRGVEEIAKELPTAFEAGVAIVKQSTQALADFISTSIVSAFDPTDDSSLKERFARFLQGIANIILQQVIQLAIAAALQKTLADSTTGAVEIATATTVAAIKLANAQAIAAIQISTATTVAAILAGAGLAGGGLGLHKGGLVKGYASGGLVGKHAKASAAHANAKGFARGGINRPAGLHPADTVPAWLQPGEFVLRKSAVDRLNLGWLNSLNEGRFNVAPSSPPSGASGTVGMRKGGLVQSQSERDAVSRSDSDGQPIVVPAVVAGERNLDRMFAGGKSAARQFLQDNAGVIRSIARGN